MTLIGAIGFILFKSAFPEIEVRLKPPINSLVFDDFSCDGPDAIVLGVLDKAFYRENEATFLGLNIYSQDIPRRRFAWERVDTRDKSPSSRPAGVQIIDLRIIDGCGVPFKAYTRHLSPVTGLVLPMSFGPFGPESE